MNEAIGFFLATWTFYVTYSLVKYAAETLPREAKSFITGAFWGVVLGIVIYFIYQAKG